MVKVKFTNEADELEKLKGISRNQHFISDTEYFEDRSLYDNLFVCPKSGCTFKNLYYDIMYDHIKKDIHSNQPVPKVKIIIEDEDDTKEETI